MPVDTSMYNTPPPQPFNALSALGTISEIQNRLNQQKLFEQQFRANKAMGPILQGAIDPQTGQLDPMKALVGLSSNNDTAFLAPGLAEQLIKTGKAQQDVVAGRLSNALERNRVIGQTAAAALNTGIDPNTGKRRDVQWSDLLGSVTPLWSGPNPAMSREEVLNHLAGMQGLEGQALTQRVQQIALQAGTAGESLDRVLGKVNELNTGGATSLIQAPQVGGVPLSRATVPHTLTPGEAISPQKTVNPQTGEERTLPRAEAFGQPGGVVTGLAPDRQQFLEGQGKAINEYAKDINDNADISVRMKQLLGEMRNALKDAKVGGGGKFRMNLAQMAQAAGFSDDFVKQVGNGDLAASQILEKLNGTQAMNALRQGLGGGKITNFEFENSLKSNPNLDTDPKAFRTMLDYFDRLADIPLIAQRRFGELQSGSTKNLPKKYLDKDGNFDMKRFPAYFNENLLASKTYHGYSAPRSE